MKSIFITDTEETLELSSVLEETVFRIRTEISEHQDGSYGIQSVVSLLPEQLLQVRDWINERVRELQFHGYIADAHLGD